MNEIQIGAVIFGLVFLLIFTGLPVAACLALGGVIGAAIFIGNITILQYAPFQLLTLFILIAIPLFIFMGQIMLHSGMGSFLYQGCTALLRKVPGSLLHVNIVSCAIFAAVSGSSVATAATIGTVAIPELEQRGYDKPMLFGSLAAGGTLGILIPPSCAMIVYGAAVGESVGRLFIAGILPGILLAGLFMVYIAIRVIRQPHLTGEAIAAMTFKESVLAILAMWPVAFIMLIVLGGIYLGVATPTETAAAGCIAALVIALVYRRLTWATFLRALRDAVKISSYILFIMLGAIILSCTLSTLRVTDSVITLVTDMEVPRLVILLGVYLVYLFLGCFMDGISMMVLTLPFCFPVILELGYDPIWFGVAVVIMNEAALLTPPVGINVYTIHGLRPEYPMSGVFKGSMPFLLMMIVGLTIITAYPIIATWLPSTMMRFG